MQAARLRQGHRVLEVGAGMGRFTRHLVEKGLTVTACDVAANLLELIKAEPQMGDVATIACAAEDISKHFEACFDRSVGFFVLHHLENFEAAFSSIYDVISPGGRVAFCEPNGLNPLFYIQLAVTPSMRWKGDGGIIRMRPGVVLRAMKSAGFTDLRHGLYGYLPPMLYNTKIGPRIERLMGYIPDPGCFRAFRIFSGRKSE